RRCAAEILDRFGGSVPQDLPTLLTLPGVGPKTANCVVVFGFGRPGMPVDTHVHRISNRLGIVRTRAPEETETELRRKVPERFWIPLTPMLVQHGKNLCRPRGPLCDRCPIRPWCATGLALESGRKPPRREDWPRRSSRILRKPKRSNSGARRGRRV